MNPYLERKILDADPIELVCLLYQRAIACIQEARKHLANRRIAERAKAITQAYDVLTELMAALRPEAAPEISANLNALYAYLQQRLIEANFQQADGPLAESASILGTLLDGWNGVAHGTGEMRSDELPPPQRAGRTAFSAGI